MRSAIPSIKQHPRAFKRGLIILVTVALGTILLVAAIMWASGTDNDSGAETGTASAGDVKTTEQLSAEVAILREGVVDNRQGANDAIAALNELNLLMDGQAEQLAAILDRQQSVNPAVLEVQIEQLAQTVNEISLVLGQTRRQTQEITEIGGAVSTLQRRLEAAQAQTDNLTQHVEGLEDRILHNQQVSEANAQLLSDPTILQKPELEIDWDKIGTPEALGLCRNSQLWENQPPSMPGQTFDLDMSTQMAMYYRNEMNEGRLTEARAREMLDECRASLTPESSD